LVSPSPSGFVFWFAIPWTRINPIYLFPSLFSLFFCPRMRFAVFSSLSLRLTHAAGSVTENPPFVPLFSQHGSCSSSRFLEFFCFPLDEGRGAQLCVEVAYRSSPNLALFSFSPLNSISEGSPSCDSRCIPVANPSPATAPSLDLRLVGIFLPSDEGDPPSSSSRFFSCHFSDTVSPSARVEEELIRSLPRTRFGL